MTFAINTNEATGSPARLAGDRHQVEQLHRLWGQVSPHVELSARLKSRHLSAEAREEFLQACLAFGWYRFLQAIQSGRNPWEFPARFGRNVALAVRCGRKIPDGQRRECVMDRSQRGPSYGSQDIHFRALREVIFSLPGDRRTSPGRAGSVDDLADHARATPADHAAFRVDFERWFWARPQQERNAMRLLAAGHGAREVCGRIGVCPNVFARWRRMWRDSWLRFQGA